MRYSELGLVSVLGLATVASASPFQAPRPLSELRMERIERQTLDYSCGAAALTILLNLYFGETLHEQDVLADMVGRLSREQAVERATQGFSLLDLKTTAQRLGYQAEGVILPRQALASLKGPVIILLRQRSLNHFVVLKGIGRGSALLADPARGHIRMPLFELYEQWQGETLVLGRDQFGLPLEHGLKVPARSLIAPERETVRTLQRSPVQ
jgi:predicted double-glycine peptidase